MSATQKRSITKLGILAGGGSLPSRLLHACDRMEIEIFLVAFEGQTDSRILEGRNYMLTRVGAAGQIINTLKSHDIHDLVLIGSIRRPSLAELRPDMRTAQFFAKLGLRALGDDGLLKALRHELEAEGFTLHGVQNFAKDLIAGEGAVGRYKPKKADWIDIDRALDISQQLGHLDIGQSVIVQEGIVLGVEAAEGTDELIHRCVTYKRKGGRGGVLVKTCKPQQDKDLDLPTIGPETIRLCVKCGLDGIVMQAGHSLLLEPQKVAELANEHKMFVLGLNIEKKRHAA